METNKNFLEDLKEDIRTEIEVLINKNKRLEKYINIQIYGSIICILGVIIYCFLTSQNHNLNEIWIRYEFYIVLLGVFIYIIYSEKLVKELQSEIEKGILNIRNKMILKICNCNYYCECKEELNAYMKKKGFKII